MENVEALIFKAEEVHMERYWIPRDFQTLVEARRQGKLVLLHLCDCGCWWESGAWAARTAKCKEVFGNDPFVVLRVPLHYEGKDIVILPNHNTVFPLTKKEKEQ